MGTQGGEHLFRCPCYEDQVEYQKIVDLRDAGLVIYRQTSRNYDGNINSDVAPPTESTEDIFILQNTKDVEILSADIMPAIDPNKITCPRCRHIIENAQKLLKSIPKINRRDIMGICDHCRRKLTYDPCVKCEEVVKKFISVIDEAKDAKRHIRVWLSKIHHLLRDVIGDRNIFRPRSSTYSEINVDHVHHNSLVSLREPEVTDLFYSENIKSGTMKTLHLSDGSYSSHLDSPNSPKIKKRTTFFDYVAQEKTPFAPTNGKQFRSISNQDISFIAYDDLTLLKSQRDEFKTKQLITDQTSLLPVSDFRRGKYHSEESVLPLEKPHSKQSIFPIAKYQHLSDDSVALQHKRRSPDYDRHVPRDKYKSEENTLKRKKRTEDDKLKAYRNYTSEESLLPYKIHTREEKVTQRKHKSAESLLPTISGIIEDTLKQDFGYYFPHEVEDTKKIRKKRVSSSELIKDTQEKLLLKAEEERIRLEEELRKKKEEQEKRRIAREKEKLAREEAKRLATEAKKLAEEAQRLAEEEEKRIAEEPKKAADEEKKRLVEEEKRTKPDTDIKDKEATPEATPVKKKQTHKMESPPQKHEVKEHLSHKPKVKELTPEKPNKEHSDKSKVKELTPEKPKKEHSDKSKLKDKEPTPEKPKKEHSPEKTMQKEPSTGNFTKGPPPEKRKAKEPKEPLPKPEPKEKLTYSKSEPTVKDKVPKKEKEPKTKEDKEPQLREDTEQKPKENKESKMKDDKESVKPILESKLEATQGDQFRKLLEEQAKQKQERQKLSKTLEDEEKKAKEAAEKKLKEINQQVKSADIKARKPEADKPPEPVKIQEKPTTKDLNVKQIKLKKPSGDDLILRLVKLRQSTIGERGRQKDTTVPQLVFKHKGHRNIKDADCLVCTDSDIELELESLANQREEIKIADIIIGPKIFKYKPPTHPFADEQKEEEHNILPILFKTSYSEDRTEAEKNIDFPKDIPEVIETKPPALLTLVKGPGSAKGKPLVEQEVPKGIVRYALSDRAFIDKGWTMLPMEKVVRKMNVYRMRPAHPEFDWFEHNKKKRIMTYDTGEKLAEFDDNGRGRWFYKNGRLALDYYDAEEINAQQRFVVYSSGEPDERGRSRPITILATFDYLGNGIVFDHTGKIRLKYNQTEGVVLDRSIGPVSHWKWHTLNDPPVLQQVMIDTQMPHKDADIVKLGGPGDHKIRPDNEEMLAIEFDNFIKEKSKKLTQKFKPFQIKMKALKINEAFSLRVLDQATIYLIFRDGSANLKLNMGMILDHKEIVDTDTAEVGEVSNSLQRLPARTDSLAGLQRSVAHAQRVERLRGERARRLRPAAPSASRDRLAAAAARPLRAPFCAAQPDEPAEPAQPATCSDTPATSQFTCKCRKPSSSNLYYDTRLF